MKVVTMTQAQGFYAIEEGLVQMSNKKMMRRPVNIPPGRFEEAIEELGLSKIFPPYMDRK